MANGTAKIFITSSGCSMELISLSERDSTWTNHIALLPNWAQICYRDKLGQTRGSGVFECCEGSEGWQPCNPFLATRVSMSRLCLVNSCRNYLGGSGWGKAAISDAKCFVNICHVSPFLGEANPYFPVKQIHVFAHLKVVPGQQDCNPGNVIKIRRNSLNSFQHTWQQSLQKSETERWQ